MRVNITQELINTHNHGAFSCPVAKAVQAVIGSDVAVNGSYINVWLNEDETITISCPLPIADWIGRYDGREEVVPFSFDLDIENNRITNIEGI